MILKLKKYSKISFSFRLSGNKYIHLLNSRVNKNDNLQYCKVMALQSFNDRKEKRKEKCTKRFSSIVHAFILTFSCYKS